MNRNQSHLPTKITVNERTKKIQNVFVNWRNSTINSHFEQAKHMRMSEQFPQQRQTTVTEVVAWKSVVSSERIKVSVVLLKL
jgi:hypothetical protein